MIAVVTAAVGIVAGLLMGGCTPGGDDISKTLINRNAALENQVSAGQNVVTALAITAVILAGSLGTVLYHNRKGDAKRGKAKRRNAAGR